MCPHRAESQKELRVRTLEPFQKSTWDQLRERVPLGACELESGPIERERHAASPAAPSCSSSSQASNSTPWASKIASR